MSSKEELRKEILAFLEIEGGMTRLGKQEYLQALLDKHFVISDGDLILDKYDFTLIVSGAKDVMAKIALPTSIGGKAVDAHEVNVLCCVEATIQVLNGKGAFRKLPKFNK